VFDTRTLATLDVLRERIKNGRRSNTERERTEDCLCQMNGEKVSILRAESARWQVSATNELRYELVEDERARNASSQVRDSADSTK